MFGVNKGYDIFLGGTCNGSKWRDAFISKMKEVNKNIKCYNPIVEDWTQDCIDLENFVKSHAQYHVYVITPRMTGVYSIAEMVESAMESNKKTFFCILNTDDSESDDQKSRFSASMINSLNAVSNLLISHRAIKSHDIDELVNNISNDYNSITRPRHI